MSGAMSPETTEAVGEFLSPDAGASPSDATKNEGDPIPTVTTWMLVAMWVGVYVAMLVVQGQFDWNPWPLGPGRVDVYVAHEFGAMTAQDIARGELWRTVTATFVHFSLLHLVCNLTVLIGLGRSLESWYGAPQLVAIYTTIGAVGNLLAVAGRYLFKASLQNPCAGGSSVMFGLIAMIAVAGWRSRTRFGDYVRRKMLGKLILFGLVIGIIGRSVLDNYGHAGGAIAGAALGFFHPYLVKSWDRRSVRLASGLASFLVLASCAAAQWRVGRREYVALAPVRAALKAQAKAQKDAVNANKLLALFTGIQRTKLNYERMALIIERANGPLRADPTIALRYEIAAGLVDINNALELGINVPDKERFNRWRKLAEDAVAKQPTPAAIREFLTLSRPIVEEAQRSLLTAPGVRVVAQPR